MKTYVKIFNLPKKKVEFNDNIKEFIKFVKEKSGEIKYGRDVYNDEAADKFFRKMFVFESRLKTENDIKKFFKLLSNSVKNGFMLVFVKLPYSYSTDCYYVCSDGVYIAISEKEVAIDEENMEIRKITKYKRKKKVDIDSFNFICEYKDIFV